MPELIKCAICKDEKDPEEFYVDNKKTNGRGSYCKICALIKDKEYRSANPDKARSNWLQRTYGLTLADYDALIIKQNGRCRICGTTKAGGPKVAKSFAVDHNHLTGKVRGLLCFPCNKALGLFRDDPVLLKKALNHLEKHA